MQINIYKTLWRSVNIRVQTENKVPHFWHDKVSCLFTIIINEKDEYTKLQRVKETESKE